ncbi:DUF4038 domain-containing protein [Negadavirga shengliensis]|uniref:DUF4038 domain-containing protein n=1 Tax=Negadavirga shengliensis TaxID=1389218 RepID=A0ABV9SVQ9_9BACT
MALPLLKVKAGNQFLIDENDKPFFWLGDTAWELLHRLNGEETAAYLDNRAKKGFTVVQTVILAELDGLNTPNALGETPLLENDPTRPNEKYFEHIDQVVHMARETGLYLGLLPTWGDKYNKKWGIGPEIFNPKNARIFGEYLAKRYGHHNHIIWILGGDRVPANEEDYQINCKMALGLKRHAPRQLITLHPMGGHIASDIYGQESWLDLDMFQSRHQKGFKEYTFTRKACKNKPTRPVIDGEPGYENIPNLLNKMHVSRLNDFDVRRAAYWNMMSGAAGHTYGCNEVWQMYSIGKKALHGAYLNWREALDLPGSSQMGFMKKLFESLPWQHLRPDPEIIGGFNFKNAAYISAVMGIKKDMVLAYSPAGRSIHMKSDRLVPGQYPTFWFNPKQGTVSAAGIWDNEKNKKFKVPDKTKDWLLLILSEDKNEQWQCPFPEV